MHNVITSHNYNTMLNSSTWVEEITTTEASTSTDTIVDVLSHTNAVPLKFPKLLS